jgi:hypothetical protein
MASGDDLNTRTIVLGSAIDTCRLFSFRADLTEADVALSVRSITELVLSSFVV